MQSTQPQSGDDPEDGSARQTARPLITPLLVNHIMSPLKLYHTNV